MSPPPPPPTDVEVRYTETGSITSIEIVVNGKSQKMSFDMEQAGPYEERKAFITDRSAAVRKMEAAASPTR